MPGSKNNRLPDLMQDITKVFACDTDIERLYDAISNLRAAHELLLHAAYKFAPPDIEAEVMAEFEAGFKHLSLRARDQTSLIIYTK